MPFAPLSNQVARPEGSQLANRSYPRRSEGRATGWGLRLSAEEPKATIVGMLRPDAALVEDGGDALEADRVGGLASGAGKSLLFGFD